jgi:hypothetical protein
MHCRHNLLLLFVQRIEILQQAETAIVFQARVDFFVMS